VKFCYQLLYPAAALFLVPASAWASDAGKTDATLSGYWRFRETGEVVRFSPCGASFCRILVGLPRGALQSKDEKNPNPALRSRNLCGLIVMSKLRKDGRAHWGSASGYNPQDGKSYNVSVTIETSKEMTMRASLKWLKFLGQTYVLDAVAASQSC
jgi:uncharacterized protein (DUF2147 family)